MNNKNRPERRFKINERTINMKLNPECLRAVLLSIETLSEIIENGSSFKEIYPELDELLNYKLCSEYQKTDIIYCLKCLSDEELIKGGPLYGDGEIIDFDISEITPDGRKLLDKIRDNSKWKKLLNKIKAAGISFSIANLVQFSFQTNDN